MTLVRAPLFKLPSARRSRCHACLALCADDLALRHAASQGLCRFIDGAAAATSAAAAAAGGEAAAPEGGSLLTAAQKVLFPQLKRGLASANLAVRQVREGHAAWPLLHLHQSIFCLLPACPHPQLLTRGHP